jgi:hypothetical protein
MCIDAASAFASFDSRKHLFLLPHIAADGDLLLDHTIDRNQNYGSFAAFHALTERQEQSGWGNQAQTRSC